MPLGDQFDIVGQQREVAGCVIDRRREPIEGFTVGVVDEAAALNHNALRAVVEIRTKYLYFRYRCTRNGAVSMPRPPGEAC